MGAESSKKRDAAEVDEVADLRTGTQAHRRGPTAEMPTTPTMRGAVTPRSDDGGLSTADWDALPLKERKAEGDRVREKFPDRLPVIARRLDGASKAVEVFKPKFLVPCDITVDQFDAVLVARLSGIATSGACGAEASSPLYYEPASPAGVPPRCVHKLLVGAEGGAGRGLFGGKGKELGRDERLSEVYAAHKAEDGFLYIRYGNPAERKKR